MEGTHTAPLLDTEGNPLEYRDGYFLNLDTFDALFNRKGITGYRDRAKALGLSGPSALWRVSRPDYPEPCTSDFMFAVRRYSRFRVSAARLFTEREGVLCRVRTAKAADRAA
jgi:hypothetical protein